MRAKEENSKPESESNKGSTGSAMKEALKVLHRIQQKRSPLRHQVHVYVVCGAVIIGTEAVNCMTSKSC